MPATPLPITEAIPSTTVSLLTVGAVALGSFLLTTLIWLLPLDHYDQALFRLGADVLERGGWLYRDFWDLKQPGIYWFYEAAGLLFDGDPTRGPLTREVLLLNSLWLTLATVIAVLIMRRALPDGPAWLFVPVFALGTFVFRLDYFSVAQVESLIFLPLLGIIAALQLVPRVPPGGQRLALCFLAGLGAAVVAIFKLILAPIAAAMLVIGLLGARPMPAPMSSPDDSRLPMWFATVAGGLAGLAAALWPFVQQGLFDQFVWTQFIYPPKALSLLQSRPISRFVDSSLHLGSVTFLLIPAAVLGAINLYRTATRASRQLLWSCLAWILVGLAVVIPQRLSWHAYHFVTFIWPIGLLAAAGVVGGGIGASTRRWHTLVLLIALAGLLINAGRWSMRPSLPKGETVVGDLHAYVKNTPGLPQRLAVQTCRSALVFGSPALFHAAGLLPATTITGQLSPILLPAQWQQLFEQTRAAMPRFIYLDNRESSQVIDDRAPAFSAWMTQHYRLLAVDPHAGHWLVPNDDTAPSPCVITPAARDTR
ncbi:MAG: hypothetical protein R3E68_10045 [Burkholderiaceae bacterium]